MSADSQLRQHILDELRELRGSIQKLDDSMGELSQDVGIVKTEMKTLKVRVAGFAALIASVIPIALKKLIGLDV